MNLIFNENGKMQDIGKELEKTKVSENNGKKIQASKC